MFCSIFSWADKKRKEEKHHFAATFSQPPFTFRTVDNTDNIVQSNKWVI